MAINPGNKFVQFQRNAAKDRARRDLIDEVVEDEFEMTTDDVTEDAE